MSKIDRLGYKLSFGRTPTASNLLSKKQRKAKKTHAESARQKFPPYYASDESTTRRDILHKFLDVLLDTVVETHEMFRKTPTEFFDLSENSTQTEKYFKDVESTNLKQVKVVHASDSKLGVIHDPSSEPDVNLPKRSLIRSTSFLQSIKRLPSSMASSQASGMPRAHVSVSATLDSFDALKGISELNTAFEDTVTIRVEKIVFRNGNIYEGQTNEYIMNGYGKFTWANNTNYRGEFKDGYITGKGEITLPDLTKYTGEFCNGFFHGKGSFNILSSQRCYYGHWKSGKKNGYGLMMYGPDDWYEGDWNNDTRNGKGMRKYKNGSKYSGEWSDDKKQGKGKMLFLNNDYYCGDWWDNKPNGYGEYIWDLIFNETFCFPLYNWYKGAWKDGKRDGIGIMNFGTDCGSTYAGTWRKDCKHGPGVMVCGNGLIIESNPLFEFNKAVHKSRKISLDVLCEQNTEFGYEKLIDNKCSYHEILELVNSQVVYSKIEGRLLANITNNSKNIPQSMFVNPIDGSSDWCPLYIPTHAAAENVNLEYFVDIIFKFYVQNMSPEHYETLINNIFRNIRRTSENKTAPRIQFTIAINELIKDDDEIIDVSSEEKLQSAKVKERKIIKNNIVLYLPKLKMIYERYATCSENKSGDGDKNFRFKPVLVRFFLWQFLRDIQIPEEGVPLVDIDILLWKNPNSCLSSPHYAFEPIYFYQFLMYLMGTAWLTFLTSRQDKSDLQTERDQWCPSRIFRHFLDTRLDGIVLMRDTALLDHLHTVPLLSMYKTYRHIGEPMSVKSFLNSTHTKDGEDPPCYHEVHTPLKTQLITRIGSNAVPVGHQLMYLHEFEPVSEKENEKREKQHDKFYNTLYTFRSLGEAVILDTITSICPTLRNTEADVMKYKLTFLEFYEIVVLLAYIKAENDLKKSQTIHSSKPGFPSISYRHKMKRKKVK